MRGWIFSFFLFVDENTERRRALLPTDGEVREYEKLEMPTKTGSRRGNESTASFLWTRDEDHNARRGSTRVDLARDMGTHTRARSGCTGHVCSRRARVNVPRERTLWRGNHPASPALWNALVFLFVRRVYSTVYSISVHALYISYLDRARLFSIGNGRCNRGWKWRTCDELRAWCDKLVIKLHVPVTKP